MKKPLPAAWAIAFLALLLGTACTPLHISRTVSVKGLPPTEPEKITVFKQEEAVTRPYQILGKVSVCRSGTRVMEGASIRRIRHHAAEMGADGVIGLHRNCPSGGVYSGLAVKWLNPGETPQPKGLPFIVAMVPLSLAKPDPSEGLLRIPLAYQLDSKGYYLLPTVTYGLKGGLREAIKLDDATLQPIGGLEADFLMQVETKGIADKETHPNGVVTRNGYAVRVTLLNKRTRAVAFQQEVFDGVTKTTTARGTHSVQGIPEATLGKSKYFDALPDGQVVQALIPDDLLWGLMLATEGLPAIHDPVP